MSDHPEFDYDVFISYSSSQKEWVRGVLLERIEEAGLRAFIDFRDFERGAPGIKEMERGVDICRKTLIILTPDYIESEWCEIETIMVQTNSPANRDLRLIPLLKEECEKPTRISALTYIDFTEGADLDLAWHQLLSSLEAPSEQSGEEAIPADIQAELDRAKDLEDTGKYSEAIPVLEKILPVADRSGHTVARVKVRLRLAQALYEAREDFSNAEQHYRDALVMIPVSNHDLKHWALRGLGDMLLGSGRLDEAKAVMQAALDVAEQTGETDRRADSLLSLSLLDRELGLNDSSKEKLDEAIRLLHQHDLSLPDDEQQENAHALGVCYLNKALLYREMGDLDKALLLYRKAEKQLRISEDKLNAGRTLLFCGEAHCASANWEKGFDCFRKAFGVFEEVQNSLWSARSLERISRLYATHEKWEKSLHAMLGAADQAMDSEHPGEQVHYLCLAAKCVRTWKREKMRQDIQRQIYETVKDTPDEEKADVVSSLTAKKSDRADALAKLVREDDEARDLLNEAKEIARRENLHQYLANCLLDEAREMIAPDNTESKNELIRRAVELLKEELRQTQSPKRRGHLIGRISALYSDIGQKADAKVWLKKAGKIFEKHGDLSGLAHYHESLAEIYREEGRLDKEIAAYRKVLSITEGRSFHYLAAGTKINLATALGRRREFDEAQQLLNEAEALCDRHEFKDLISAIAQNRSEIERKVKAAQAPALTLPELLRSLEQLFEYRPEDAVAYLPFWYFAWNTQLRSILRSGPKLSFMVVTNDVNQFMRFADVFRHLADHFLMNTSSESSVEIEKTLLSIPPNWQFPLTFHFAARKKTTESGQAGNKELKGVEWSKYRLGGSATVRPLYYYVSGGQVITHSTHHLPQEAIDLMIRQPMEDLIDRQALWLPTYRSTSKDPLLNDLQIGHQHGVFSVYLDRFPTSDAVTECGGVEITIPEELFSSDLPSVTTKWRRALLKLTKLPKDEAQVALFDLPGVFAATDSRDTNTVQIEVRLFEFSQNGQRVARPAILIQE